MSCPSCVDPDAEQTHQSQQYFEGISGLNTYKIGDEKSVILIYLLIYLVIYL